MLKISVYTWSSYTMEHNLHNHEHVIIVLLKALYKTMRQKDATIFCYMHCVPLSIVNMLTVPFSIWKVNPKNGKRLTS